MCSRFSNQFINSQHNLKMWKENGHKKVIKYSAILRQRLSNIKTLEDFKELIKSKRYIELFSRNSKPNQKSEVFKVLAHHCEFILAQRLRRCQQMFSLYATWWEEQALKEFLRKMRQNLSGRCRVFTLGAVGISSYNWEQNRIPECEIKQHAKEFEYIDTLKEKTICLSCDPTKRSNNNTKICKCGTSGIIPNTSYEEWVPFIEKQDLVVWRRLHPSGQYEYKVFGSYDDVTAEDFLHVQVDTDYRMKWDNTTVMLKIGERDPEKDYNGDILYWEMQWPRFFTNRDYVFVRRYLIDQESKTLYIMNKSTEYEKFPKYDDKYRIEDYVSIMVIRPYTDIDKPGIEFSLTYFDNPGVNIPASITNWIAKSVMPDFLDRLRKAAMDYKAYCIREGVSEACLNIKAKDKAAREKDDKEKLDYCSFERQGEIDGKHGNINLIKPSELYLQLPIGDSIENKKVDSISSAEVSTSSSEAKSFWRYLHPLYYFH